MMLEPNWQEIQMIADRAEELQRAGRMDETVWRRLLADAFAASGGRPELTDFLAPYAKSTWLRHLRAEEQAGESAA
jgi:hypothetical protein